METQKTTTGLPRNTAAALSYVALWPTGLIFLLIEKDPFVRFHAMQSLITFGVLNVLMLVPFIGWILTPIIMVAIFVLWLFLLIKAYQGEEYELPIVGPFAKQQLGKIK